MNKIAGSKDSALLPAAKIRYIITGILLVCSAVNSFSQDLLISPLRVVFEGTKKSQEISLANVGKDTAVYAISVKDYRMKEDGSFEEVTEPDAGQNFAGPYIRFFPRKVTLAPNEAQVVKLQVIKSTQMAPGEYRSHLYFRPVLDETPLGAVKAGRKDTGGISIQLTAIVGITMPVIIRVGDNTADATLSNLSLDISSDTPRLTITFNRTGNMSVYGDLKVEHISSSGKTQIVKTVRGIGVYTPINARRFRVDLDTDKKVDFHKGKLRVTYRMQMSDKTEKSTEAEIDLK
jgi:hypothetical protein